MKDYIQETKKTLMGYKENKAVLESKRNTLQRLKDLRIDRVADNTGVSSTPYDNIPAKTNKVSSTVEQIALKNAQLEVELKEQIDALGYYINRIDMGLEEVKHTWREVLELKYVEGNTWVYTSMKLGLSEATCRRYGDKGIKALADKLMGEKSYIDLPLFRDIYIDRHIGEQDRF